MKHTRSLSPLTKRLIKGVILSLFLVAVVRSVRMDSENQDRACLEPALEVGAWLQSVAIETQQGKTWAVDPENPNVVTTDLYNGMGGVILFFVELYRSTDQKSFLAEARARADDKLFNSKIEPVGSGSEGKMFMLGPLIVGFIVMMIILFIIYGMKGKRQLVTDHN